MDWESYIDKLGTFGERVGRGLKSVFGSRNERMVREGRAPGSARQRAESWAKGLTAEQFLAETARLRALVQKGEKTLDEILPEAFALVREASQRTLGLRHYDVQLVGGVVLHQGRSPR
jgi:preprotein translocase subunit SecA